MGTTEVDRRARDATRAHRRALGAEVRRLRDDAGISLRRIATVAGVSRSFLSQIEAGTATPSIETLNRLAVALGADLSVRFDPNTGPRIRDRWQARMVEALLRILHPRWRPTLEVAVRHPARGFIDAVLDDRTRPVMVAVEAEGGLRRVEQHLRWCKDKAASLPSSELWRMTVDGQDREPGISRLLLLRSTRHNRDVVRLLRDVMAAEYPADPAAVRRALTTADAPWPGAGILWVTVRGDSARILERAPPGLGLGRV